MIKNDWLIRRAELNDLARIMLLEANNSSLAWSSRSIEQDILGNPAAYSLIACTDDGGVIGFAACWFVLDEAQIMILTVDGKWRRRGLGRSLLSHLEQEAVSRKAVGIMLEVRAGNQAARALYEGTGFQVIATRPGYYADTGEDAIIMLKDIGQYR